MAKRKSLVGNGTATCYREAKVFSRDTVNATYTVSFTSDLQVETVAAADVHRKVLDVLEYLWDRRKKVPKFYAMSLLLALLQPSSAAAERVFSQLKAFFDGGGQRGSALEALVETTLQLRMHRR